MGRARKSLLKGEGDTEVDKLLDDKDEDSIFSEDDMDDIVQDDKVQTQVQCRQKKKRGHGLPALIEVMQKHPCPVGGN